jgi:TIR domain
LAENSFSIVPNLCKLICLPKGGEALKPVELFISHASEDKDTFVRPLADALIQRPGFKVFYDDYSLFMGDSLLASISKGLRECDFGIVIFSPDFLRKKWPQVELDGLFARETIERKIILPVWYKLGREEILAQYPSFADRVASKSTDVQRVVSDILRAVQVSQRTKEINTPIMNKIESLATKAAVRARSDELRNSRQGVALAAEEVRRIFDLFEGYFEPHKGKLGLNIVRDPNRVFILARTVRVTMLHEQGMLRESRRSRIAFRCEYPTYTTSGLHDVSLKLSLYHEIYDSIGDLLQPEIIHEWQMTPAFNAIEEVVWTNFGPVQEMRSEDLLDWTLTFFLSAIENSISYDRSA